MGSLIFTIKRLQRNSFLRHNAIFFFGSVAVGILNYLYYPLLGRLMPPAEFGEVQTLVSFFLQLSIFLSVLGLVTVNVAANYDNAERRNRVIFELERIALIAGLLLLALSFVGSYWLQDFFRFDSATPFVVLAVAICVTVPFTFRGAFVRGRHGFGVASLSNIIASAVKIFASLVLVLLGFSTAGAIWGIAIAQCVALIYIGFWAKKMGLRQAPETRWRSRPDMKILKPELRYAGMVLITSLLITLQFSIDILVVKHYFDAHTAGLYAGIATVARVLFFVTGSISQVLMPSVKMNSPDAENRSLLFKSLGLVAATGLPVLALFVFAPSFVVQLLMGHNYTEYASLLPMLGLAIFVVAVVNLLVSYYMALRRYIIAPVVVIGAVTTYGLMISQHSDLAGIVRSLLIGGLTMIILIICLALRDRVVINKRREHAL